MVSKTSRASNPTPSPKAPSTDRQFVTALARGLAVLRCFDATRPQLGTTQIAQLTKLPQPTVWRLCYTLQQLGYLVQVPDSDKLRIGMSVLGLGQFALASDDVGQLALPEMQKIAQTTGAAVSLGVIDQQDVLIVKRAQGGGALLLNMAEGSRLPVATTSAGWAYLACLPRAERQALLPTMKSQYPGRLADLRAAVDQAADHYLSQGFVLSEGFFHPDVNAVGAPVLDRRGTPVYVLSCGGPGLKIKYMREEIGPQLGRLAQKMSMALSARG